MTHSHTWALTLGIALAGSAVPAVASAQPSVGPSDVATVFYIAKSDDRNRVDYGIHLGSDCQPAGDAPLFAYWHRFEPNQPVYGALSDLDHRAYGIRSQRVVERTDHGSWVELILAALPHERILVLTVRQGDQCVARARARVGGKEVLIGHVFVQLGGLLGVDHLMVIGEDVATGHVSRTRMAPPPAAALGL